MQYVLFIVSDPAAPPYRKEEDDIEAWGAYVDERDAWQAGGRLRPPSDATTVTVRDGRTILTDGPFTETREWIAGFDLIEVPDLDAAIDIAARHPMARFGRVEVRPSGPSSDAVTGGGAPRGEVTAALQATLAAERLAIVATLIRRLGDWELAEDAVQEAAARALVTWPERGIPRNPGAWLTTAARNAAIDAVRRTATERATAGRAAVEARVDLDEDRARAHGGADDVPLPRGLDDDRLRLVYTCCHPALAAETRIALTLRTVLGLEVDEIARVLLTTEAAMHKRLVRARARIREAGIPYRVPDAEHLPERTDAVLAVLYLLFTEGYAGGGGYVRPTLADEAIRLARLVASLLADSAQAPEAHALLALLLFQHSRAAARLDEAGDLVLLEDQDRTRWDSAAIADGLAALTAAETARARLDGVAGPYRIQAEIARHHATAPSAASTDFVRIAELYDRLARVSPSPVVELNRAVAVGFAVGPEAGLALLDALDADLRLARHHLLPAARAGLLVRAGRADEALPHYERGGAIAPADPERRFLARRIDAVRAAAGDSADRRG